MITLRRHQVEAADAVEQAYAAGIMRPLVDACVGSGKSLIMAELARRAWERGERTIICAHTRELVQQNAAACRALGLQTAINCAALDEKTWRAPVICASIQSVSTKAHNFGLVMNLFTDECHLIPHSESGMYREFHRGFRDARTPGFSGTVFRLQGGSLVEGEAAPFDKVVYTYPIYEGIRDGYLVPVFSAPAEDKVDPSKLRKRQGEFTADSQDAQMIGLMDNHIAQMVHHGANCRAWLVFEASVKAAKAMTERLNQWGVSAGLVLGETPGDERAATIEAYRRGRLRCLVNVAALTTGFDVQEVDLLVMRRRTTSLGLYIQMTGRLLRTIGGNMQASIAAGKEEGLVLDFAGNIDMHGALDMIRPKQTKSKLVSCEKCGKRNSSAAMRCWNCDEPMTKNCPACLVPVLKGTLDCPHCGYDMRQEPGSGERAQQKLHDQASKSALIAAFKPREGGWIAIKQVWDNFTLAEGTRMFAVDVNNEQWEIPDAMQPHAREARWIKGENGQIQALLKPNGRSRSSALQVTPGGAVLPIPMPPTVQAIEVAFAAAHGEQLKG